MASTVLLERERSSGDKYERSQEQNRKSAFMCCARIDDIDDSENRSIEMRLLYFVLNIFYNVRNCNNTCMFLNIGSKTYGFMTFILYLLLNKGFMTFILYLLLNKGFMMLT